MDPHGTGSHRGKGKACRKVQHRWVGWSAVEWTRAQGIPFISNCPKRTRGDAAIRSARPPVLPPPPRPPQCRSRHLVSRAGTPRCACVGTAFEGLRRCRAAILSVASPAGPQSLLDFGPLPFLSFFPAVLSCGSEEGEATLWALGCELRKEQTHKHVPCLSFPHEHTRWGRRTQVGGTLAGWD